MRVADDLEYWIEVKDRWSRQDQFDWLEVLADDRREATENDQDKFDADPMLGVRHTIQWLREKARVGGLYLETAEGKAIESLDSLNSDVIDMLDAPAHTLLYSLPMLGYRQRDSLGEVVSGPSSRRQ